MLRFQDVKSSLERKGLRVFKDAGKIVVKMGQTVLVETDDPEVAFYDGLRAANLHRM